MKSQSKEKWSGKPKKLKKEEDREVVRVFFPGEKLGMSAYLEKNLNDLGFGKVIKREDEIVFKVVESEDLKNKPHLYFQFNFKPDGIELEYTITKEVSRKKRELDITMLLLEIMVVTEDYILNFKKFYEHLLSILESATEYVDPKYDALKAKYDSLLEEMKSNDARYKEAILVSEKNNKLIIETEKQNEMLRERVKKLESIDDDVLYDEITRWIKAHGGMINIVDFANSYNVPPSRVKMGLDYLMRGGYIKRVN